MFLQYSLKTNRLKLMMTSTRKLAHHCLHRSKSHFSKSKSLIGSSIVHRPVLAPHSSPARVSPSDFTSRRPPHLLLLLLLTSSPSALLYALTLPPHPRLGPNAFLRPLVLKIRVNPDQLKSPPSVSLFFSTQVKNNIRVSLILFSPIIT